MVTILGGDPGTPDGLTTPEEAGEPEDEGGLRPFFGTPPGILAKDLYAGELTLIS